MRGGVRLLLATLLLAGCAAPDDGGGATGAPDGGPQPTALDGRAEPAIGMPGMDDGLQVRQWRVQDAAALAAGEGRSIGAAFRDRALEGVVPEDVAARLARSGLRVLAVPESALRPLAESLGGGLLDVNTWHGQAPDWRPLALIDLAVPRAVALDGRVRRFEPGSLRLQARAWTLPTLDGPRLQVDLRPEHVAAARGRLALLPGREPVRAEPIDRLRIEVELPRGVALVLTTDEGLGVPWDVDEVPAASRDAEAEAPGADDASGDGASGDDASDDAADDRGEEDSGPAPIGPDPAPGPLIAAPPSLGELLLRSPSLQGTRDVLILVPHLPARLDLEPAESGSASEVAAESAG